jgi:RNA polymerase-binding transcription factor DksA
MMPEQNCKEFSLGERYFLQSFGRSEIMDLADYFEEKISEARSEFDLARERFLQARHDPVADPFHGEGGRDQEEEERELFLLNRFDKKLEVLIRRRKLFMANPEKYFFCEGCGRKIPLERFREVPHCRHCVTCKENR